MADTDIPNRHKQLYRDCEAAMIGFRTLARETQTLLMRYITARTYVHAAGGTFGRKLEDLVWQDVDAKFGERIDRDLTGDVVEWMVPKLTQLMAEHDDG